MTRLSLVVQGGSETPGSENRVYPFNLTFNSTHPSSSTIHSPAHGEPAPAQKGRYPPAYCPHTPFGRSQRSSPQPRRSCASGCTWSSWRRCCSLGSACFLGIEVRSFIIGWSGLKVVYDACVVFLKVHHSVEKGSDTNPTFQPLRRVTTPSVSFILLSQSWKMRLKLPTSPRTRRTWPRTVRFRTS